MTNPWYDPLSAILNPRLSALLLQGVLAYHVRAAPVERVPDVSNQAGKVLGTATERPGVLPQDPIRSLTALEPRIAGTLVYAASSPVPENKWLSHFLVFRSISA